MKAIQTKIQKLNSAGLQTEIQNLTKLSHKNKIKMSLGKIIAVVTMATREKKGIKLTLNRRPSGQERKIN